MRICQCLAGWLLLLVVSSSACAGEKPARAEVAEALKKAVHFFHKEVASHGGYVWKYSDDLKYRVGEGVATASMIWVQPPGTPAVGEAFLKAYHATGDPYYLTAARDTARALVNGQLDSGGWYYHIEFDPEKRGKFTYRKPGEWKERKPPSLDYVGGWDVWRQRKDRGNITILDDDVTPAALRLLMRVDQELQFKDSSIHDVAEYALASTMTAQYPNGAWSHNYDRFPLRTPDADHYPVKAASYPESWSRKWTNDWTGCYSINDRITPNMIKTMLAAYEVYGDKKYLAAAERGGQFLLLAQMPDPQPAWAQQYNRQMQPVWERKFEPPSITALESQDVLETLLLLYRKTADRKYLAPVPKALDYLKKSQLPGGKLARFYELKTNRPLYFDRKYKLTYDSKGAPDHYAFLVDSRLDEIDREYRRLLAKEPAQAVTPELAAKVRRIIDSMDRRGAWLERGFVRDLDGRKVIPEAGIISSQTFIDNVATLCLYLQPQEKTAKVPGVVIDYSPAKTKRYIGSPSIVIMPDGDYVASHDFFGPGSTRDRTVVFRSNDRGKTWKKIADIKGQWWSSLFLHKGALYLMGTSKEYGFTLIRRSTDGGKTWTTPKDGDSGLLLGDGKYHCAPVPVVVHNGRIWRAMEDAMGPGGWGMHFRAFMMSAPVDADLLKASSWTCSNRLARNPKWLDGKFGGWLEGNAVVTRKGKIVNILRVHNPPEGGKAALIHISDDGKKATFDPDKDFIDFPGGTVKFTIRWDPKSKYYWSLTNYIPPEQKNPFPQQTRNTLALVRSADLRTWEVRGIFLHHPDRKKHGFQYVDWQFEGDDLIIASRTAYDDGQGGAHNQHDANYMTFHRLENFRTFGQK